MNIIEELDAEFAGRKTIEYPLGYAAFFAGHDKSANIAMCSELCGELCGPQCAAHLSAIAAAPKFGHPEGVLIRPVANSYELWIIHSPTNTPAIAMAFDIADRTRVATLTAFGADSFFREFRARGLKFAYAYQIYMSSIDADDAKEAADRLEEERSGFTDWSGANYRDLEAGELAALTRPVVKNAQV